MINKEQEVKREARKLYSEKKYDLALNTILELDITIVETFLIKESKANNKWFQDFLFCDSIANNEQLFKRFLDFSRVDELLHEHFKCKWNASDTITPIFFQLQLAEQSPELFVRMIRVSQTFLKNTWYTVSNLESKYFKDHQLVWKHLQEQEGVLWNKVSNCFDDCIGKYDASYILVNMVFILEQDFIKHPASLDFLSQIYNAFIPTLLSKIPKKDGFKQSIKEDLKNIIKEDQVSVNVFSLYEAIFNWKVFINTYLDPYCYDLKIEPNNENGLISFNRSSKDYYKWELDGKRYEINRLDYQSDAIQNINNNYSDLSRELSNNDIEKDYELNCQRDYLALNKFLEDFKLSKFPGGNNLDSIRFFQPLISASNYYKKVYEIFHSEYNNGKNFFSNYNKLIKDYLHPFEKENFPFIFSSVDEFYHRYDTKSKNVNDLKTKKTILSNPFSYSIKTGNSLDRFNLNYNVFKKPFLKIDNYIFTPTLFLAKQDWFYSFTQNALERLGNKINDKVRKESSTKMEYDLKDVFEKAGFKTEIFGGNEFSNNEGDVDLKVTDGKDVLLIQLKRTKLRLTLKEAYFEHINTDKKASRQINNVEEHFTNSKGKIFKWIVTTSYENVYTSIQNCLKVNYFDLLEILKPLKILKNHSVNDLNKIIAFDSQIKYVIESKAVLNHLKDNYKIYDSINIPLPLVDPIKYREVLFRVDKKNTDIQLYDQAMVFDRNGDYLQAEIFFKKYLKKYPNDFDALADLANVLANRKCFEESLNYYKKALNIVPNDLFVIINYILILFQVRKTEEALTLLEKITAEYWFVDLQILNYLE
ncbi:hypothetical protein G1K75_11875 [Tenacibaculum finnmarkense]|uniref:tetratricopeptide repeat protein n=1 Tax=Tenacibaculum finnmarkense TaxID=2781243 RepID=UPI00187B8F2B|nr:hypothetical protein [Tenacibaculum finnmarkense]MBE7634969.1 hypothetical protein [Tenacibaculum finnmarkense genomovar ulcerans]MCD8403778.1 hypothetical protein [Tenacibaculum finnmarkense genomovar finnmarkense]MCD8430882.1 hypothetical protein [Tenacibaculum finnmarkense genomovar ulcerans]MCD8433449.1 hypothetical protein [Tenacibaculum finnmarkense genomovar ulcerans]MCG8806348.1 hypothetical protein [Tenacibaculum finnmarkense]